MERNQNGAKSAFEKRKTFAGGCKCRPKGRHARKKRKALVIFVDKVKRTHVRVNASVGSRLIEEIGEVT